MKKIFPSLLLCFFLLTTLSCTYRVTRDSSTLLIALPADPEILNPLISRDAYSSTVLSRIYESLLERDNKTLAFKPMLASRWEIGEDQKTYTFHLRQDVKWQDGFPFTADDVLYSFERVRDPKVDAASLRVYYQDVESVKKIDSYTIQAKYKTPYFKALEMIGGLPVLPKHLFDTGTDFNQHPANRSPIGTGAYRFQEWKSGQKITLTRNEHYWGKKPDVTSVIYQIIPDATVSFQMLKKGSLDFSSLRSLQWAKQTSEESFTSRYDKYKYYTPNFSYIGWNLRKPYFSDKRVRQALAMMLDREKILEKQLFGLGEIVSGPFYRFGPAYNETVTPYPFNPERAKQLLDEAGWKDHNGDGIRDKDGVPFRFRFLISNGSKFAKSIGLFLREELGKVGIEVSIEQLEFASILKKVQEHDFDSITLAFSLPFDQDPYQLWHSSQIKEGSNVIGFQNKEIDRLIESARPELDAEKRAEIYKRMHAILHEEQPFFFLFTNPSLVAISKRFSNVHVYKAGFDSLEWQAPHGEEILEW
ncbi:MAG: hypothetical protein COX62_05605 [Deltaproteobacteria bacterium CG_4_10_14_0_2_um_filter_43_8]|nr:MAG: hypothetical protein COV43_05120 [Deltaproteobacteria bacterium CG11_big_fil_rev_8_21_14_0_20_42_23]PJA19959.1 MAG: hypothetical protein COX62_05605 [Deltaproteobacteria bacterium CG_4_10_14_0_2_um_filter_43_8]PJC63611.1 MAG: hypothetical protein CO021_08600 [Deltaproteobacteria bacterium CG_4_9_14_0_2_um_filter_42_21]